MKMAAAALGTKGLAGSLRLAPEAGLHLGCQDPADAGARQVRPDLHLLWGFDAADAGLDEDADLVGGDGVAGTELKDGGGPLAPLVVWEADDRAVEDRGVGEQGLLYLG